MENNWNKIINHILEFEGGWVNDPNDKGGETYRGIARNFWPKWEGWKYVDEKNFAEADKHVVEFYKLHYWTPIKGDNIPVPLDLFMMDTAVNCGVGTTLKLAKLSTSADDFLFNRIQYYLNVIKAHPTLRKYESNWIGRALKCRKEAQKWA